MKNCQWAHALIDQLIQQGVRDFCIAPGSRSAPLALAAARHPKGRIAVHFDERGLGFFGLGLSIAEQSPAALIVTSGTAVGNLLPSIMEAHHSHAPLIILTADRPPELQGCGANQSTDQIKIFQNFTLWHADLPCPDGALSEDFVRSQAAYAVFQAKRGGPVHLNCQFREPLFEMPELMKEGVEQPFFSPVLSIDFAAIDQSRRLIEDAQRGLILIGRLPAISDRFPLFRLARRLRWPIFADILSQERSDAEPIRHFDEAIRSKSALEPDFVLHFGGGFVSKALPEWIDDLGVPILHVNHHFERLDLFHKRPTRLWADPARFCESVDIGSKKNSGWLEEWQEIDRSLDASIEECFTEPHPFTEADLLRNIDRDLPIDWSLFFANSMPIRHADRFFFSKNAKYLFANRGLSGIDGQIATAAGIAARLKTPMAAIIGDQSCLHDLNSLPLLRDLSSPFLLIISNNFGGGIFSRLPMAQEPEHFERLFGAAHPFRFNRIAEMFHLPYRSATEPKIKEAFDIAGPSILEVFTSRKENASFEKKILEKCLASKDGLSSILNERVQGIQGKSFVLSNLK
jgi:2-succinyl-5-enolpyruvyl-6-hydroxy-3-cyclohexene-1-carboxylate synthase